MDRLSLKSQAKQQIKGNIGILFLITLIITAITSVTTLILSAVTFGIGSILVYIILPAFSLSIIKVYLNLTKNIKPTAADAFSGFSDFWSAFKLNFLTGLFTSLWSLLFAVPGIVKSYSYSLSTYILAENKSKPALECINESKEMTEGHKMDLFILDLSFTGWYLLSFITLGIAFIWVIPYRQMTFANAYNSLKPAKSKPTYIHNNHSTTTRFCHKCGCELIDDCKFCSKCGAELQEFYKDNQEFVVCIYDEEKGVLKKENRKIDIIKFPPEKYSENGTYYAIETIKDGKKVRIYHTKENWHIKIENLSNAKTE